MEWIEVGNKFPKPFESVLINIPDEAPLPTVHEGYYANGEWFSFISKYNIKNVSHWAKMPEPPIKNE